MMFKKVLKQSSESFFSKDKKKKRKERLQTGGLGFQAEAV